MEEFLKHLRDRFGRPRPVEAKLPPGATFYWAAKDGHCVQVTDATRGDELAGLPQVPFQPNRKASA